MFLFPEGSLLPKQNFSKQSYLLSPILWFFILKNFRPLSIFLEESSDLFLNNYFFSLILNGNFSWITLIYVEF